MCLCLFKAVARQPRFKRKGNTLLVVGRVVQGRLYVKRISQGGSFGGSLSHLSLPRSVDTEWPSPGARSHRGCNDRRCISFVSTPLKKLTHGGLRGAQVGSDVLLNYSQPDTRAPLRSSFTLLTEEPI